MSAAFVHIATGHEFILVREGPYTGQGPRLRICTSPDGISLDGEQAATLHTAVGAWLESQAEKGSNHAAQRGPTESD